MLHTDKDASVDVNHFSIERLIRLALRHRLFTDYRMTSGLIRLYHENGMLEMDPEEARFFLRGMMFGFLHTRKVSVEA